MLQVFIPPPPKKKKKRYRSQGCETRDRVTPLDKSLGAAIFDFESVWSCISSFFFVPKEKNQQINQLISCVILSYKHHLKTEGQNFSLLNISCHRFSSGPVSLASTNRDHPVSCNESYFGNLSFLAIRKIQ